MYRIVNLLLAILYKVVRPLLFRVDAEAVHGTTVAWLGGKAARILKQPPARAGTCEVLGTVYQNPFGLAAGFLKNPADYRVLGRTAFGYAELGSITGTAQSGNPRPRLFRFPEQQMLLNRMGFNNEGVIAAVAALREAKFDRPYWVNFGMSKVATDEEQALADMAATYGALRHYGAKQVLNLASPNTPGLRQLLRPTFLNRLSEALCLTQRTSPLLVKIHGDLAPDDWKALAGWLCEAPVDGVVCSNTTIRRDGVLAAVDILDNSDGGISGAPLFGRTLPLVADLVATLRRDQIVVACGGINSSDRLAAVLDAGAVLAQGYSGWIYGGPGWERKMVSKLD